MQLPLLCSSALSAAAKPQSGPFKEADNDTSPYIQALLAKSNEKREERAKQMLKDYMKKNYRVTPPRNVDSKNGVPNCLPLILISCAGLL